MSAGASDSAREATQTEPCVWDNLALSREIQVAEAACREAADIILRARPGVLEFNRVKEKDGGEGPVTEADLKADSAIRAHIAAAFPRDALISEETYCDSVPLPTSGRVWMVDPLDGTKNFINPDSTDFCVMIGMCIDGVPVLGVIMEPSTGRLWKGINMGSVQQATYSQRGGKDVVIDRLSGNLGPTLRFGAAPPVNPRFTPLVSKMVMPAVAVPMGSAGLKAMLIVDGLSDIYTSSFGQMSVWDICASHAILAAIGGNLLTLKEEPINYSNRCLRDGLFFYHPGVNAEIRKKVRDMYEFLAMHYAQRRPRV